MRACLLPLMLAFSSCAPSLDAEQGRLCRMLIPALFMEDEGIRLIASEGQNGKAVHIAFQIGQDPKGQNLLSCRFGGEGYSSAKRDLVAVSVNGVGLGESSLYFLKERWLESPHAVRADPGPPRTMQRVLHVPLPMALALQHLIGGLPKLSVMALLALATALIYGLIGRLNLAFGEFAAMGGIVASISVLVLSVLGHRSVGAIAGFALLYAVLTTYMFGTVLGNGVLAPLARGKGQPILIAGVGLLILVQEGLRLAQGARTLWLPPVGEAPLLLARAGSFDVMAHTRTLLILALVWVVIGAVFVLMTKTRFGRAWRALADDPLAAALCGIDARTILVLTSGLATALAGLAGGVMSLIYGGMQFSNGTLLGLSALMAAILGGVGSLSGAVLGAVVIGLLQTLWMAFFPIAHWELATFCLLTLALWLKPGGFFGYADGANRKI
jgi:branched-chain amino acid transport system permease protein